MNQHTQESEKPPRPIALMPLPDRIPQALRDLPQWILWRYECRRNQRGDWRWTKVPLAVRGGHAKTNDPSTWSPFSDAWAAYMSGRYDGVGLCMADGDGLVGIDLDHCVDERRNLTPEATALLEQLNTYTELSPSGEGIRAFCYGSALRTGKGGEGNWIEVYDHTSPRYLAVTGQVLQHGYVESRQDALAWLHHTHMRKERPKPSPRPQVSISLEDQPLLEKARRASNGAAFSELYDQGLVGDDWSSADLTLCNMLAFWTGCDEAQMDRLFRSSALYRPKWDERRGEMTYGQRTLSRAIQDCTTVYSPQAKLSSTAPVKSGGAPEPEVPESIREEWQEDMLRFGAHDDGNARTLHLLYGKRFCYVEAYGWLHYNGTHWERKGARAALVRATAQALRIRRKAAVDADEDKVIKASKPNATNVRNAIYLFEASVTRQVEEFDSNPDLLNVANGVVHLPTGELLEHSPEQSFTYCLPTPYHPQADSSLWEEFLSGVVELPEMVEYLQQSVGYSLTGHISEEVLWYIHGPTRSGKGTFTETLTKLLGKPLSIEVDFATFTRDRDNDASNFDLAGLKPARFVAASESKKNQRLNAAKVKTLTGGNDIHCCYKRKDHFTYRPQFKLWLTSNFPPVTDVDDDAVWGRLRILTFPHSHLGEEDKNLKHRIQSPEVLQGVLAWAVRGAQRWYENRGSGLATPGRIHEAAQEIRSKQDTVAQWMAECLSVLDEPLEDYPGLVNKEVYHSYREWCEDNGVTPKKQASLTRAINSKGVEGPSPKKVDGRTKRVWSRLQFCNR